MGNTKFYEEAKKENSGITWKDIFSESFKKHTREDREYAMQVGTVRRTVSEREMLNTWHRPWLWWPLTEVGMILFFVLIIAAIIPGTNMGQVVMAMNITPLIVPFIIMVFIWELNVAQNISFGELIASYFVGAIVSFFVTSLLGYFAGNLEAPMAGFLEEPAKIIAVICILWYMQKFRNKKIYGVTAMVVGAAVGSAFTGMENVAYAWAYSGIRTALERTCYALGGHIMYAMPYATAIGIHCKNGKMDKDSIYNSEVIIALCVSIFLHFIWNGGFGATSDAFRIIFQIGSIFIYLYWIKKALRHIVQICMPQRTDHNVTRTHVSEQGNMFTVRCESGSLLGKAWRNNGENTILIGRIPEVCAICFGEADKGVSRKHCKISYSATGWKIQDLNSTYGTYVGNQKLVPYQEYTLRQGNIIFLGSKQVALKVL